MSLMKAIQIKEFKAPFQVSKIEKPSPTSDQVLIRIKAGGFCHSDVQRHNGEFGPTLPYVGSHEAAGVIEEVGSDVQNFKVGDRVGHLSYGYCCDKCGDCKTGRPIFCEHTQMPGITIDGAWAEYMIGDPGFLVPLPDHVLFDQAAAHMCAGGSIYGAIMTAGVKPGGSLAIIGIGGLGHIGTQIAKALGCTVVAVDTKKEALDLAMSFKHKPDICMNPKNDNVEDILKQLGPDEYGYTGVDAVILATDSPASIKTATDLSKKHGTLVLLGQPGGGVTMKYQDTIYRDIKLVGSWGATPRQAADLMELVQKENIQVQIKTWRLDQAEEMRLEVAEGLGRGKMVIVL